MSPSELPTGFKLSSSIAAKLSRAAQLARGRPSPRVALLLWLYPMYPASSWIHDIISSCGATPCIGTRDTSLSASPHDLDQSRPDVIIVSICGGSSIAAARTAAHQFFQGLFAAVASWELPHVRRVARAGRVAVVDGDRVFCRSGSLVGVSAECLREICYPES